MAQYLKNALQKQAKTPKIVSDLLSSGKKAAKDVWGGYQLGRRRPVPFPSVNPARRLGENVGRVAGAGNDMNLGKKMFVTPMATVPGVAAYMLMGKDPGDFTPEQQAKMKEYAKSIGRKPRRTLSELVKLMKTNTGKAAGAGALAGGLGGYALGSRLGAGVTGAVGGTALGALLAALAERQMAKPGGTTPQRS